mgnify:CR=1 FL=1
MEPQNTQTRSGTKSAPDESAAGRGGSERVEKAAEQVRAATEERVNAAQQRAQATKDQAAERVRKLSSAVRKIGEHMRIEDQQYIAERASQASERLDAVAAYIAEAELSTLVRDAEDLARRKPAMVFGGTFLLGFAAARLLKSGDAKPTSIETTGQLAADAGPSSSPRARAPVVSKSSTVPSQTARPRVERGVVR